MRILKLTFLKHVDGLKVLVSGLLLAFAFQSNFVTACTKPVPPEMPNIEVAVVAEMVKAQKSVKRYMKEGNEYLACTKNDLQHDAMVARMEKMANKFNGLIRDFKALKKK